MGLFIQMSLAVASPIWRILFLGIFFTCVHSNHSGFDPSHENRSFISHENRSLKPSFLSHQKFALRNLADASIPESCKTAVDDSRSCREYLSNAVKANCKGTEDIFSHYTVHGTAGAPSWIRGQSGLTGSTNHVRTLMEKELSKDNAIAWVKAYAKEFSFWYIFLGLGLIWIIAGLIWWPGLCSTHCRRCLGKCFCKKCCNQRIRARPVPTVTRTKYCLFLWWFVVTSVALLAFVGLAIFDSVQIHKVSSHVQCVLDKLSYFSVFGDSHSKSRFGGMAGIPDMLYAGAMNATEAADVVDKEAAALKSFAMRFKRDNIDWYIKTLKANHEAMVDTPNIRFLGFDNTTTIMGRRVMYCLTCQFAYPVQVPPLDLFKTGARYTIERLPEDYIEGVESVVDKMTGFADKLRLAADDYIAIEKEVPSQTIIDNLLALFHWKYNKKITSGVFAFLLTTPLMIFIVWVVSLVLYSYLWTRYSKQKTTNHKQLRNWFGCLCWFFTLCGILVLVVGVLSLMAAQPVSEGCEFAYNDLMTDNKFMEYEGIKSSVEASKNASLSTFTNECLTTNGKGDLKVALTAYTGTKAPDSLSKINGDNMKAIDSEKANIVETFQHRYAKMNEFMESFIRGTLCVTLGIYDSPPSETDFLYASTGNCLYGCAHYYDTMRKRIEYLGLDSTFRNIALDVQTVIEAHAKKVVARRQFLDRNGKIITDMVANIPKPPSPAQLPGRYSQSVELQQFIVHKGCRYRFLHHYGAMIETDASAPDAPLSLQHIISRPSNALWKERYYDGCLDELDDGDILRWIMGFNVLQMRWHIGSDDEGSPRPYTPIGLSTFVVVDPVSNARTLIELDFLSIRLDMHWEQNIYSFEDTTKAMDKSTKAIEDAIAPFSVAGAGMPLDCRFFHDQFKAVTDFLCYNATYDIGRLGMSWILMAFGLFILSILTWKIFHYFADLRYEDVYYSTPEAFFKMSRKGRLEELKVCCQLQVAAEVKDEYKNSGLHIAAYHRNPDCCSHLLTQGLSPDENNEALYSPLHIAVVAGDNEIVKRFIEAGADIRQLNWFGDMPLHSAAMAGERSIIDTLLEAEEKGSPAPLNLKEESPTRTANRIGKEEIAKRLGDFFSESSIGSSSSFTPTAATPSTNTGSAPAPAISQYTDNIWD